MLLTGDCLRREIKVRLRDALKRNATDAAVLQTDYDGLLKSNKKEGRTSSDDFLRYFLLEVLENVHWASKLKHLARKYRREATGNRCYSPRWRCFLVLLPHIPLLSWLRSSLYTVLTFGLLGRCLAD
jgi:hypothetical protein